MNVQPFTCSGAMLTCTRGACCTYSYADSTTRHASPMLSLVWIEIETSAPFMWVNIQRSPSSERHLYV